MNNAAERRRRALSPDWSPRRVRVTAGVLALLIGLLFAGLGIARYGGQMWPNLLAELAGLPTEVAIVLLVVDGFMDAQRRREWRAAYAAISLRLAAVFVDVMRLLYVRSSSEALEANISRHDEFVDTARMHLDELRSNIEGFAIALDPKPHEASRRIDRRLSWAINILASRPHGPGVDGDLLDTMVATSDNLFSFLKEYGGDEFESSAAEVESAIERAKRDRPDAPTANGGSFRWRLRAQQYFLDARASGLADQDADDAPEREETREGRARQERVRSIINDIDHEVAVAYFLIDHAVLRELPT